MRFATSSIPSFRSSRRRWPACRAARSRSRCRNAGGLGSLPCAMLGPDAMRDELRRSARRRAGRSTSISSATRRRAPDADARSGLASGARSAITASSASTPTRSPPGPGARAVQRRGGRRARGIPARRRQLSFRPAVAGAAGARARAGARRSSSSATTVEEARWLEAHGVDAIIAQGLEAGGHRGMFLSDDLTTQVGTFALLPQVVEAVKRAGDRRGRHRRREGRRGRDGARRRRRAGRHGLSAVPRGDDQRRAPRRA